MWTCQKCGTKVDEEFEICWNCGTSNEGVEDPHFHDDEGEPPAPVDEAEPGLKEALKDQTWQNLVTVATFRDLTQAHALKMRLESEGIKVFLADAELIAMDWLMSNAVGGVKVQVGESDLERTRELLAE